MSKTVGWCVMVNGKHDASFRSKQWAEWWAKQPIESGQKVEILEMEDLPEGPPLVDSPPGELSPPPRVDIVDRLRASVTQARAIDRSSLLNEAAHEIKVLRLALATLAARNGHAVEQPTNFSATVERDCLKMENKLLRDTNMALTSELMQARNPTLAITQGNLPVPPQSITLSEPNLLSLVGTLETPRR